MKIRNIAANTVAVLACSALLALVPALAGDHAAAGFGYRRRLAGTGRN